MNFKELKEMISLMNENNLTELELEREGLKIRLKRGGESGSNIVVERFSERNIGYAPQPAQNLAPEPAPAAALPNKNLIEIKAPMVGTFYRAPSPDAAPFVEIGSKVEIGQVICIIEAMKLMNEIKSEVRGKVVEILIENADPLEFGQVLFRIDTTA